MPIDIDELIEILPKLIRENDTIKGAVISALGGIVATKEDIKFLIESMNKRFEAVDKRFEELIELMDKRFEAVDKRFEAMDKRFEAMDKRFEAMDKRFEAVDKRFEELIELMDKRFEAVDKRFEAVDKRFEAVDKRFEAVINSIKDLTLSVSRIESKEGILFEKTVLELMKETLQLENIDPSKIRKEYLYDLKGVVFHRDYATDIDVLVENDNLYLVEVKATANRQDVEHFLQNIRLYEQVTGKKVTRPLLIALRIFLDAKGIADRYGIRVIAGTIME
ncbi:MAG: hypothetical protein ACTSRS_16375 [Candidatus Helarchaeota archaeon]